MDINRVILIGRLVRDPESRVLPSGVTVTSMRIAVNRRPTREGVSNADFFDIIAWRQLAEICSRYLKKGQRIAVEGSLRQRSWQDQNGNYQSKIEIVADNIQFLEPKTAASADSAVEPSDVLGDISGEVVPGEFDSGYDRALEALDSDLNYEIIDDLDEIKYGEGEKD